MAGLPTTEGIEDGSTKDRIEALAEGLHGGKPGDEFATSLRVGDATLFLTFKKVGAGEVFVSAYNATRNGKWVTGDLYCRDAPERIIISDAIGDAVAEYLKSVHLVG